MTKAKNRVQAVIVDIDIEGLGDDWESLADAGRMIWEAHDRDRWKLGQLGGRVSRKYGENSIGKFAMDIHCSPSIMYQYYEVWAFYSDEDRAVFPSLTWSHYRAAKAAKNHEMAVVWLGKAADGEWTVEALQAAMESPDEEPPRNPPVKLAAFSAEFIEGEVIRAGAENEESSYLYMFRTTRPVDLTPNRVYEVKLYGVREGEPDE